MTLPTKLTLTPILTRAAFTGLKAELTGEYVVRHTVSGGDTSEESDDTVEFITRNIPPKEVTIPASLAARWGLTVKQKPGDFLAIQRSRASDISRLCFAAQADADELRDYIARLPQPPSRLGRNFLGIESGGTVDALNTTDLTTTPGCR